MALYAGHMNNIVAQNRIEMRISFLIKAICFRVHCSSSRVYKCVGKSLYRTYVQHEIRFASQITTDLKAQFQIDFRIFCPYLLKSSVS